jgi:hypothetical protein
MSALTEKILPQIKRFAPPAISYGVPGLMVLTVAGKIIWATAFGVDPAPLIPPVGYVADENRVALHWRRGDVEGELTVEVAKGDDFGNPVFSARSKDRKLVLPRLEPGQRYCWRVRADGDAGGVVSCFETSNATVTY